MATEDRETAGLIGSDKVDGTAVYGSDGNKIGSIERVMIEKVGGKVSPFSASAASLASATITIRCLGSRSPTIRN